ncbi:glycine cleavage system protein H [Candidatus Terasakiella magnetica]|uniref:glycine cleavage system protein H n=1 Tax=Candidatus Terasakiella magnetica TaxID=1867952 RepID=UPI00196A0A7D|nr:hypothetical protein [Candidatus Terasakiella magnetica]
MDYLHQRQKYSDHSNLLIEADYAHLSSMGLFSIARVEDIGAIKSAKALSKIYPLACGEIVAANAELEDNPPLVNQSPKGDAWLCRIKFFDASQLDDLMDADAYQALIA